MVARLWNRPFAWFSLQHASTYVPKEKPRQAYSRLQEVSRLMGNTFYSHFIYVFPFKRAWSPALGIDLLHDSTLNMLQPMCHRKNRASIFKASTGILTHEKHIFLTFSLINGLDRPFWGSTLCMILHVQPMCKRKTVSRIFKASTGIKAPEKRVFLTFLHVLISITCSFLWIN